MLRKLFGSREPTPGRPDTTGAEERGVPTHEGTVELRQGREALGVVGESNYQGSLRQVVGGDSHDRVRVDVVAVLSAETNNPYDSNAVSIWINGLKVGYLARADATRYRPGLLALESKYGRPIALAGVIAGGGMREDGPAQLGVFLRHDPVDFGLTSQEAPPRRDSGMDTGLTDATATDGMDDSYDLSWADGLAEDPIRAIPQLRQLLANERDAIDRHFMFHHLETALYKSRDVFASALTEYDDCCHQHDAEMETIREAFMAKWGMVPWLHTYKQMCIRLAKAKEFEQALRWAERGLALYGEDAGRPDSVEDLRKRAEAYRAKLARP
jgi:hypothetical protein